MTTKKQKKINKQELDGIYILKTVLFFLLGCMWVSVGSDPAFPIPVGLLVGIVFASHDHFQIDRKIEYVVLLAAALLSFIAPIGFVLNIN